MVIHHTITSKGHNLLQLLCNLPSPPSPAWCDILQERWLHPPGPRHLAPACGGRSSLTSPRGARAFHELRRYHTRPLRLNWGPGNVHFGKTHFWDPNINVRILFFLENLKNYQAQLFYVLSFPLGYLKTFQSSKNAVK